MVTLSPHLPALATLLTTRSGAMLHAVGAYRSAGGDCQYEVFEGSEHEWVATPGPQTDRARAMVKAFVARQLKR